VTIQTIKDFVSKAPEEISDLSFAISREGFGELQASSEQYFFQEMIVLNIDGKKVTVFKERQK